MENAIVIHNLSKQIKGNTVLRKIDLSIDGGTICGFVGPNGSGKTMLFRAIAGFLNVPNGCIEIDPSASKGVIIENPAFINEFSGFENLKYLASIRGIIDDEAIKNAMEQIGLDSRDTKKVKTYSLGMKQKLAIVQATMESPDILILDEPTRGLDEKSIYTVHKIIRQQHERGATILIASHSKEDISELCQKVYELKKGSISEVSI